MSDMTIRVSTLDDLDAIARLDSEVFGVHSYSFLVLRQMWDIGQTFLIAESSSGEIVGYTLGALETGKSVGWILALAVRQEFRRQGIASKLTLEIIDILGGQRVDSVLLTVSPDNRNAIHLYEKMGFFEFKRESDYFGSGEDRIVMKKRITNKHVARKAHAPDAATPL